MSISDILFSYSGRINRGKFWATVVGGWVFSYVAIGLISAVFGDPISFAVAADGAGGLETSTLSLIAFGVLLVAMIYSNFAVMVKRCHDRGKSGWWSLISLIPIVGAIWAIIDLGIMEGDEGTNQYGPNPLAA